MPTPSERLEARRQLMSCKLCAWLSGLDSKTRAGWIQAISNPRYAHPAITAELAIDGCEVSQDTVQKHRAGAHRV